MSISNTKITRQGLYEQNKNTRPEAARKIVDFSDQDGLMEIGKVFIGSTLIPCLIAGVILGAVGLAFGRVGLGLILPCGSIGGFAGIGLLLLAVGYCKKQKFLHEELSTDQVNKIPQDLDFQLETASPLFDKL
jgi:hypothetical protein